MNCLLVGGLLTMTVLGMSGAAFAQTNASDPSSVRTQSAPLVTQPASVNQMPGSSRLAAPYTSDQLNSTLGVLQANPKAATPAPTGSIESLIQRFSNADRKPTAIDPIDFFKPPALDGGVKIPLQ
ncbi:MAG: hypothetical protein KME42_04760 [Tildeniella nuda ZEHNDER 1965/U140]|jgi:hypothetical protein|nr:hypothetical protein [Tildeniella nuda ZEHNDER 1965/U140]